MKSIISIAMLCLVLACGKNDKNPCGNGGQSYGGVGTGTYYFYRVFYKTRDFGGGPITIQVKDRNGNIINPTSPTLSSFYRDGGVTCDFSAGVVRVPLITGQQYTYNAFDGNRNWIGTIPTSCTPESCETIELK